MYKLLIILTCVIIGRMAVVPDSFIMHTTMRHVDQNATAWRARWPSYTEYNNITGHLTISVNNSCISWMVPYTPILAWMNRAIIGEPCSVGNNNGWMIYEGMNGRHACVMFGSRYIMPLRIRDVADEYVITFIPHENTKYHMNCTAISQMVVRRAGCERGIGLIKKH